LNGILIVHPDRPEEKQREQGAHPKKLISQS